MKTLIFLVFTLFAGQTAQSNSATGCCTTGAANSETALAELKYIQLESEMLTDEVAGLPLYDAMQRKTLSLHAELQVLDSIQAESRRHAWNTATGIMLKEMTRKLASQHED